MKKNAKFNRSIAVIAAVFAVGSMVETAQAAAIFTPPNAGAPKTRIGGGVRGNDVELLAMPKLDVLTPEQTGYTTQASPSLYYYVSEDTQLEFEFTLNKDEQTLFETRMTTELKKGINQVSLKELGLELDEDVEYEWNVAVIPDPTQGSLDVTSTGTIKRVKAQKKMANYEQYAENGIWYDMLEDLNGKIDGKPADNKLRKERADLLKQVGLAEVSQYEMSSL